MNSTSLKKRLARLEAAALPPPREDQPRLVPANWGDLLSVELLASLPHDDLERLLNLCEFRLQVYRPGQDPVRRKIIAIFYNITRTCPDPTVREEWQQKHAEEERAWQESETLH